MTTVWAEALRAELAASGMTPGDVADVSEAALAEAAAADQPPEQLFGPAVVYARQAAGAVRGASVQRTATSVASRGRLVLRLAGVSKAYGRRQVLDDVSLEVHEGEVAAVVGANGSGKSTLLGICAGTVRPSSGLVERVEHVGLVPQQGGLAPMLTVEEHLDLFGAAGGLGRGRARSTGRRLLGGLGWSGRAGDELVGRLSGGTQQKLTIAVAQVASPRLLLLDEPYHGLDQASYLDFWDLVAAWRDAGAGVLVVTHLLHDLDRVDRVVELASPERAS